MDAGTAGISIGARWIEALQGYWWSECLSTSPNGCVLVYCFLFGDLSNRDLCLLYLGMSVCGECIVVCLIC